MNSLRASLQRIGELSGPGSRLSIPSGFHSVPSASLQDAIQAMNSPRPDTWYAEEETDFSNEDWTEECQGLTWIGQSWYVASNSEERRAVYRLAFGSWEEQASASVPAEIGDHIGGLASYKGVIYVPVDGSGAKVWMLNADLMTVGVADLSDKPGVKDDGDISGWCAINPWNGFYYTSGGHEIPRIHAYDPSDDFSYQGSLALGGPKVNGIQGGFFSSNGRLYVNSDAYSAHDHERPLPATKDIRAYSSLNGHFFGSCSVPYDEALVWSEEMEGFTVMKRSGPDGKLSYVHVVVLDNDLTSTDDVRIVHFAVPDPSLI